MVRRKKPISVVCTIWSITPNDGMCRDRTLQTTLLLSEAVGLAIGINYFLFPAVGMAVEIVSGLIRFGIGLSLRVCFGDSWPIRLLLRACRDGKWLSLASFGGVSNSVLFLVKMTQAYEPKIVELSLPFNAAKSVYLIAGCVYLFLTISARFS